MRTITKRCSTLTNFVLGSMCVLEFTFFPLAQEGEKIKLKAELVNIDAVVMDHGGQRVRGLKKEDFEVFEDGVKQEISHFATVDQPLQLVLLFDTSISMEEILSAVKQEGIKLADGLRPADKVVVASFAREVRLHTDWVDKEHAKEQIGELKLDPLPWKVMPPNIPPGTLPDRNTNLYEALHYIFERFGTKDERVAILIFSDGVDSVVRHTGKERSINNAGEVVRKAQESWVTVYPICFKTEERKKSWPRPVIVFGRRDSGYGSDCELFFKIGAATGGKVFEFATQQDLAVALQEALADLRSQYSLAYSPSRTKDRIGFHHIKVRVKRPDLVVRTRNGYLISG